MHFEASGKFGGNRKGQLGAYNSIIQKQLQGGIVDRADLPLLARIPHKPVISGNTETTKIYIVYDASAHAKPTAPSLNECLNVGPPLHFKSCKVFVRKIRFHSY